MLKATQRRSHTWCPDVQPDSKPLSRTAPHINRSGARPVNSANERSASSSWLSLLHAPPLYPVLPVGSQKCLDLQTCALGWGRLHCCWPHTARSRAGMWTWAGRPSPEPGPPSCVTAGPGPQVLTPQGSPPSGPLCT